MNETSLHDAINALAVACHFRIEHSDLGDGPECSVPVVMFSKDSLDDWERAVIVYGYDGEPTRCLAFCKGGDCTPLAEEEVPARWAICRAQDMLIRETLRDVGVLP